MPHLLHLDSAASQKNSRSREITATFADAWRGRGPEFSVTYRDLHREPLPHLADAVLHWPPRLRPEGAASVDAAALATAEALQDELIGELLGADVLLVGAPLYNYTVPSTLKAWIDQVHVLGVTAPFGGKQTQPYKGKPAVIVASQGLAYDDGPQQGMDHGVPVLREILGRALGMDVTVLYTRYTLATRVPLLEQMIGRAAAEHEAALRQAAELATTLA